MADWTMEEPAAVWAPRGLPMAPASVFGSCPQTSVPNPRGGQLFDYAATQDLFEVDSHNTQMTIHSNSTPPIRVFEEKAHEFKLDMDMMKMRMHRYPPSIQALGESHTVPRLVAIGPYHHWRDQLKKAEKAKHVAAYHCIRESGRSVQEMYDAVISVAYDARRLYDDDVMAGIGDDDFLPMMFYDACFLVQYLALRTGRSKSMDPSLRSFFDFNSKAIHRDVMLLENQLPWRVVVTVMSFRPVPVPLEKLIARWRNYLQDRKVTEQKPSTTSLALDNDSYEPPHLLGLCRYYVVGSSTKLPTVANKSISISVSAIELAEIGITLKANETTDLAHMGLNKRGAFFTELSLAPLSLTDGRVSRLINMAALELCTTSSFRYARAEDSAVCSYLRLLSMLVNREDDVHELRTKGILQGGSGLTNKEALDFFTKLQSRLPHGRCYVRTMEQIENYRVKRRMWIKVYAFVYRNIKTILTVITATAALVGIFGTLISLKARLH
ncbi:unnamed protein product [Urochloa humidicola]